MNFLYFAYGVGLLVAMVLSLFLLTLLGSQFLSKALLETVIHPLFFLGLIFIGYRITVKAPFNKILYAFLLAFMLVAVMGSFIFISGFVPAGFNLFLLGSFLSIALGCSLYSLKNKYLKTN